MRQSSPGCDFLEILLVVYFSVKYLCLNNNNDYHIFVSLYLYTRKAKRFCNIFMLTVPKVVN